MIKLLRIVVLFLTFCSVSFAQSMISIKQYTIDNSNDAKDPIVQTYVLKRCGAAYLYAASITKDKSPTTAKDLLDAFDKISMMAGAILMSKMNWTVETAGESVTKDIDNMLNYYQKDGADSFARTGNYMMNNYIGDDLVYCKGVVEAIQ